MIRETTDEISRRLQAGEEFTALAQEYGDGQGAEETWFHPLSEQWEPAFREAAANLQNPGDVSQPVATAAGVVMIQYTGDVEGGEQQLSAEEEQALEAAAYRARQMEALSPLIQEWSSLYEIETHPELLDE
jgi:parvulin-like peptidyl-prolyl isomerase